MSSPRFSRALLVLSLAAWPLAAAELTGEGKSGDWRADAPGVLHRIELKDLPRPLATESVKNHPNVVSRPEGAQLQVPAGFQVQLYAEGFENPRHLTTAPNGDIFVSESEPGIIRILRDTDGDGKPDQNVVFAKGLKKPFGVAFYPSGANPRYVYIGNTDSVVRLPYHNGDLQTTSVPEKIADLPASGRLEGGGHWTRDLAFSPDDQLLFASVGSITNAGVEGSPEDAERARIYVMDPEGRGKKPYATGLRNPVGLAFHPKTAELWASVNERDELGDDLVPDYITHVQAGGFYGWPWSYLGTHPDPRNPPRPPQQPAQTPIIPDVLLQAHSASLNITFYTGQTFPREYHRQLFAAFHGSWNRETRTGYKVVCVPIDEASGQAKGGYQDFLTGFVLPNGDVWGRPVGLCVTKDGALLVSEDGNKTIWRIAPVQK